MLICIRRTTYDSEKKDEITKFSIIQQYYSGLFCPPQLMDWWCRWCGICTITHKWLALWMWVNDGHWSRQLWFDGVQWWNLDWIEKNNSTCLVMVWWKIRYFTWLDSTVTQLGTVMFFIQHCTLHQFIVRLCFVKLCIFFDFNDSCCYPHLD